MLVILALAWLLFTERSLAADPSSLLAPFATGLVHMGCLTAMQLDQNGTWPFFATFKGIGTTERKAVLLDQRMIRGERVLGASRKDFIALFAPDLLKPGVLG